MRAKATARVARAYKRHLHRHSLSLVLRRLLIECLSAQEGKTYDLMVEQGDMTTGRLAITLDCKLSQASSLLNRLWKYGLANRAWDAQAFCYIYQHGNGVDHER